MTGPSLAGLFGRQAGTLEGFGRYSNALKESGLTWDESTLDAWLEGPVKLVPGTSMLIRGMEDSAARQDLIAYLELATAPGRDPGQGAGTRPVVNLKQATARQQITGIRYCRDAYYVTLATGDTFTFWEFNLRFKTDSGKYGPPSGQPAILRAGMRGDRAFVVFSDPAEISAFIRNACAEQ